MCIHIGPSVLSLLLQLWHFAFPHMRSVQFSLSDLYYLTHSHTSSEFCTDLTELWLWEEVRTLTNCNNRVHLCVPAVVLPADRVHSQTTITNFPFYLFIFITGLHHAPVPFTSQTPFNSLWGDEAHSEWSLPPRLHRASCRLVNLDTSEFCLPWNKCTSASKSPSIFTSCTEY